MPGDHTRFTFDPRRRFAAVQLQQGRVQLNSDWNESLDILRERTRLLGLDVLGPAAVPQETTPDAFKVGAIAGPPADLSIEPGRIYVDGYLAEILPDEAVTYLDQPFLPDPPAFDPAEDTIVYLDLWEREVTAVEEPLLLDVALGGVDTTTRIQQVWQVRLLEQDGAACGVDLDALFPPSAGRLTTSANAPPTPDDPCILPPNSGYRGLENRLYRVEIQVGGPLGTALFKYSRDHGSIASRVTAIQPAGGQTRLTVNRIGRDANLRLHIDDWVTLTDDHHELDGEAGVMARIVDIQEATRQVVLDRLVPVADFGPDADAIAARNTRLQRWDQRAPRNAIDGDGLMATAAGPIDLDDGIQVAFSEAVPGGEMRVGDYWVFAARTADASVEILTSAPPRGIRHHYLQLGAIAAGGSPQDCRPQPDPGVEGECCCVVVRPGESIQEAIDKLPDAGGCVCLLPGAHPIGDSLHIRRSNVTLKCESGGAIVTLEGVEPALIIGGLETNEVEGILVSRITFRRRGGDLAAPPIVSADNVVDSTIERCRVLGLSSMDATGIALNLCRRVRVEDCEIEWALLGVTAFGQGTRDLVIVGNTIMAGAQFGKLAGFSGIVLSQTLGHSRIEDNVVAGARSGIVISDKPDGEPEAFGEAVRVRGNEIALSPLDVFGQDTPGLGVGIELATSRSEASQNRVVLSNSRPAIGIRLTGTRLVAEGNDVSVNGETDAETVGIQVGVESKETPRLTIDVLVSSSAVSGCRAGIAAAETVGLGLHGNRVAGDPRGTSEFGIVLSSVSSAQVTANDVSGTNLSAFSAGGRANRLAGNQLRDGQVGIGVVRETGPIVAENRIAAMREAGIEVGASGRCDVAGNRLTFCGYGVENGFGLIANETFGELNVAGNEVMDTGLTPDMKAGSKTAVGLCGMLVLETAVEGNLVTYSAADKRPLDAEDRALLMQGLLEFEVSDGKDAVGFPARITGNTFLGSGWTALVELRQTVGADDALRQRFERVQFSNNYCLDTTQNEKRETATVLLVGRAATVMGNQVKGSFRVVSFDFSNMPGPFIGNITRGEIVRHPDFPVPESAFNFRL